MSGYTIAALIGFIYITFVLGFRLAAYLLDKYMQANRERVRAWKEEKKLLDDNNEGKSTKK